MDHCRGKIRSPDGMVEDCHCYRPTLVQSADETITQLCRDCRHPEGSHPVPALGPPMVASHIAPSGHVQSVLGRFATQIEAIRRKESAQDSQQNTKERSMTPGDAEANEAYSGFKGKVRYAHMHPTEHSHLALGQIYEVQSFGLRQDRIWQTRITQSCYTHSGGLRGGEILPSGGVVVLIPFEVPQFAPQRSRWRQRL